MLRKIAKTTLFATIVASVLSAGALSVRQLRSGTTTATCGGTCNVNSDCTTGCVCSHSTPITRGVCTTHYVGVVPAEE